MKLLALVLLTLIVPAVASEKLWLTDFSAAQTIAKNENKIILLDFTGSDWCGWCIKIDKEIFETSEFQNFAKKNLVLVTVDFPRSKPISPEQLAKNKALAQKYSIQGYPTLVLLNSQGEKVGEMGYVAGGPKEFLKQLKLMLPKVEKQ